jgi:hypothetical protein
MTICDATKTNGEPCAAKAVKGGTRCPFHVEGKVGAQPKLTPELADRLVSLLQAGNYITVAAREVGISSASTARTASCASESRMRSRKQKLATSRRSRQQRARTGRRLRGGSSASTPTAGARRACDCATTLPLSRRS